MEKCTDIFSNEIIYQDMQELYSGIEKDIQRLKNKTVLISGAYGLIARYLVLFLIFLNEKLDFNIQIYALARDKKRAKEKFFSYNERSYFHLIVSDLNASLNIKSRIDYIIHAASIASPAGYAKYPVDTLIANSNGTYHLLELARKNEGCEFLFLSSGDVYGSTKAKNISENKPCTNIDLNDIRQNYAVSKIYGEMLCKSYFYQYGVRTKISRISHTYSPLVDYENDARSFGYFIKCAMQNKDIKLYSDGSAKRAFSYITDTLLAMFYIIFRGEPANAYNTGNYKEFKSIKEIAQIILSCFKNKELKVITDDKIPQNYTPKKIENNANFNDKKLRKLGWGGGVLPPLLDLPECASM